MSLRVAFGGRIAREEVRNRLSAMPEIAFTEVGDLTEIAPLVDRNDVLVISDPRGAEGKVLADALRGPNNAVRWIQCVSAGVDGIVSQGIPASIVITNQGGAVAPTVAEHAMALLLGMARQIGPTYERSLRGTWDPKFTPPIMALEGRTLAVVGFGNIAATWRVARRRSTCKSSGSRARRMTKSSPTKCTRSRNCTPCSRVPTQLWCAWPLFRRRTT
jgi:phosphoglycerate dehydrogenase-like enzyme